MKPLDVVYWVRFALGAVAAALCAGYVIAAYGTPFPAGWQEWQITIFFNSMSIAIIVYIISYYAMKGKFKDKVSKTSKLFTTGIGVYFLSWLAFYALIYTSLPRV
jgi:hypothetical protein